MATEFVSLQLPPGDTLADYVRGAPHDQQASTIPHTFREAMEVREEVYVKEQSVPLENEFDDDDPRSFHWVAYASVGNTAANNAPMTTDGVAGSNREAERRKSESTATRVPIGTVRLVPPPHEAHGISAEDEKTKGTEAPRDDSAHFEEPDEPYVKLGRLAVIKPYRGLGLSRLLVKAALDWAKDHGEDILPPLKPADVEAARQEGKKDVQPWNGLMLVHAQTQVRRVWEGFGFAYDEKMGTWMEEGIEHIGLWKRLEVKGHQTSGTLAA